MSLVAACGRHALAGHDLPALLGQAIAHRRLDDANSIAGILHWRLDQLAPACVPVHPPGQVGTLPDPPGDPYRDIADEAAKLMDIEASRIRAEHATGAGQPPDWARSLGSRPTEPDAERTWVDAITAVDIYRRTHQLDHHIDLLGPAPTIQRPDAARAHAEAQQRCDHLLACRIGELDTATRDALLERQRDLLDNAPPFDPSELAAIHRQLIVAQRNHASTDPELQQRLAELEHRAIAYSRWIDQATLARRIPDAVEQLRSISPPTLQLSRRR